MKTAVAGALILALTWEVHAQGVQTGKLDGLYGDALRPCYAYKAYTDHRGCRIQLMSCPNFGGRAIVTAGKVCPPKGGLQGPGGLR